MSAIDSSPQLRWGATFENVLDIAILDDKVAGRVPREGSEWGQSVGGVEDAWIVGQDYVIDAAIRWVPHGPTTFPVPATPWSGPTGVQAFLDWARAKNTFRFVPDRRAPLFYIDGCYLVEPWSDSGELETDGQRRLNVTLRNPSSDFHLALRGLMFEYTPGGSLTDPAIATFARASAARFRGDPLGLPAAIGASAATGVLRDRHYEGSLRVARLECLRVQLVTNPENFGAWTVSGTPVLTATQADPFGGTAAYLIDDNDGAANEFIFENTGFTGNAIKSALLFIKKGTATAPVFKLRDTTGAADRLRVSIAWTGEVPTPTASVGTVLQTISMGNGWYAILCQTTSVTATNTNRWELYPAGDTASATGTTYFFGANAWDAVYPSAYRATAGTNEADQLKWPHAPRPQAFYIYAKFVERGNTQGTGTIRQWRFGGSAGGTTPPFFYITYNAQYGTRVDWGLGAGVVSAVNATVPAIGDVVEMLVTCTETGVMQMHIALNGGAPTIGSASAANPLAAAWVDPTFYLHGTLGDGLTDYAHVKYGILPAGETMTIAKAGAA